jgi:FdhE protein
MTRAVESASAAFEARAERAERLARDCDAAREPLEFVAGLLRVQSRVAAAIEAAHAEGELRGRFAHDADRVVDLVEPIASYAARSGPRALADAARARHDMALAQNGTALARFWSGERTTADDYLSRALLRPYVEALRALGTTPDRVHARGHCPFCGGAPIVACLRGGGESAGATRALVCGLCGLEWPIRRILCPACFESDPLKLPAFNATAHPNARIEACETCRRYSKCIDLSNDARAVPEVDDLVSLSLDLWAIDEGFERIEPGHAGV